MPIYFGFLLIASNVITMNATRVLVTLYALALGAEPLTVGMLAATFAVFPMLLSLQAGRITDRLGSRLPIMLGSTGSACALLLPYFFASIPALFVAAALTGLSSMFCSLSNQNLIGTLSTATNRTRNFNNASLVVSVAAAAGPLFAGFAIDHLGHAATFLCVMGLLMAPVILLAIWGRMLPAGQHSSEPARAVLHMLKHPLVWPLLAASGLSQSGIDLFQIYIPVYGVAHGLSASEIGMVLAMPAAGGFAARIILMRLIAWSSEEKVLAYALFVGALGIAAVPFFQSPVVLGILALVFGFGMNCTQPITISLLYGRSPQGRAGEALGLRFTTDNAARLVSPAIFGVVATVLGLGAMFWLNALVLGCGGFLGRYGADRGRRTQRDA